jgi:VCBS repeat-containing protein
VIHFSDLDLTDRSTVSHSLIATTASAGASVSTDLAAALADLNSTFTLNGAGVINAAHDGNVTWNFALDNSLTQYLATGETVTVTYRISVSDDSGITTEANGDQIALSSQDVVITLTGTNDIPLFNQAQRTVFSQVGGEDLGYTITELELLAGYSDTDATDDLRVQNLAATNGTLQLNNNSSWTFTPNQDFNGTVNLSYQVNDANGGVVAGSNSFNIAAINDAPIRTAGRVNDLYVIEDSGTTSLGLGGLSYGRGGGADETTQTLSYRVLEVPTASLGSVRSNGNAVAVGQTLTLADLQGLQFRAVADANGSGAFRFEVRDNGTSRGIADSLTLEEKIRITVLRVNDVPMRTAGDLPPLVLESSQLSFDPNQDRYDSESLGLNTLAYGKGGGVDESTQQLRFTITAVPNSNLGVVLLNDDTTTVGAGQSLTINELQTLRFRIKKEALSLDADQRIARLSFAVEDSQSLSGLGDGLKLTEEKVIYLSGSNSAASATKALMALLGNDPTRLANLTDYLEEFETAISTASNYSSTGIQTLDTNVYSSLSTSNPLYVKRQGGLGRVGGAAVNYISETSPIYFTINLDQNTDGSYVDSRPDLAGIQTSYSVNYTTTIGTQLVGWVEVSDLVDASPLGKEYDRYFKYISEQTLLDYGAIYDLDAQGQVQYNDSGDILFTWDGVTPNTNDQLPLATLLGEIITAAGYYDFTRLTADGDGATFRYEDQDGDGIDDTIVGVDINFTDNMFGDNSPTDGIIVDPGSPVSILPVLGNGTETVYSGTGVYAIIPDFFSDSLKTIERDSSSGISDFNTPGPGGNQDLMGTGGGNADQLMAMNLAAGGGGGASGAGDAQPAQQRDTSEGMGDSEGNGQGRGGNGLQVGPGAGGAGLSAMNLGGSEAPKQQRDRGLPLQPIIDALAAQGDGEKQSSFVLSRIQEGSLMGNHLLDALALGAGVAYGIYAPKATAAGRKGIRGLVSRVQRATGLGNASTAPKEQRVISVFAMKLDNGTERLVAARVSSEGMTILAQQDLPNGVGVDIAGSQAQVDYGTRQLLDRLRSSGIGQADQMLVDPRLQNQTSLLQATASTTDLLVTRGLQEQLSRCTSAQRSELQAWLQQPGGSLPENNPMSELMQQRAAAYARSMPAKQASIATMVELGIAIAANPANLV